MISDKLILISETFEKDEYGVEVGTSDLVTVMCKYGSITQTEWFEGGRNGLNPEYRFEVFFGDYDGQRACIFHGEKLAIYRTFRRGDTVELYAERKQGA